MKKMIKSYMAFLPSIYKWGVLLIMPVGLVLLAKAMSEFFFWFVAASLILIIFTYMEMFADYFVFGGICSKSCIKMDYIKSAYYGDKLLFSAIVMDMLRKLLWSIITISFVWFVVIKSAKRQYGFEAAVYGVILSLVIYFFIILSENIYRYISGLNWYLFAVYLIGTVPAFLATFLVTLYMFEKIKVYQYVAGLILAVIASGLVSLFTFWHMRKRIKKSYME